MFILFLLSNWMRFSNLDEYIPEVAMCRGVASKKTGAVQCVSKFVSGFSCNCTVGK